MSLAYPKRRATLNFLNVFEFSIHSNERHKMRYFLANQEHKLDFNIHSYQLEIQAYLEKRWTKKHEIGHFYIYLNKQTIFFYKRAQNLYHKTSQKHRRCPKNPKINEFHNSFRQCTFVKPKQNCGNRQQIYNEYMLRATLQRDD